LIYEQLLEGTAFEDLLAQFTIDAGAVGNRGELGLIGVGDTIEAFEAVAFNSDVGEIAGPVETQFGFHIIRVNGRIPVAVANQIVVTNESDAQQIVDLLNNGAAFADLAQRFSIDTATSARGGNLGAFTPDRLLPELSEAIFGTAEVGLLEPVQTSLGYHIIEVVDYQPAGLVDVAHILLNTEEEALDVIALLDDGADFNQLAEERSIDPSAAGTRGDTLNIFSGGAQSGLYVVEETSLPLERVVFADDVQVGDILPPVQVGQYWLIVIVDEVGERLPLADSVELLRRYYLRDWETAQYDSNRVQETTLWRRYAPFDLLPSDYNALLSALDEPILQIREDYLASSASNNLINSLNRLQVEPATAE
jgi:parvulin-like peptidyl-prolyl isomerase